MTIKQASELEAAIERATAAGLEVVAHGYRKSHPHIKIYCVPSQTEDNRWHVISLYGSHLVCDCRSRVICTHRAAVHMELVVEAAHAAMRAAEIEAAFERDAQQTCAVINDAEKAERDEANDRRDADRWELIEAGNW